MGCENCGSTVTGGPPRGCKSNGSCMTGGCNRLNTYDWLINMPIPEDQKFDMVEVSFKNGSRKEFIKNEDRLDVLTGDMVAVETDSGFDIGRISLSGELVKTQIKKKSWTAKKDIKVRKIIRKARTEDLEKLVEMRAKEGATMLKARKFAMALKLDMKISDVEYQADNRKATFYYTAENRVDFRELIKQFAQEFKVKIEMRQIGARQEAGKIGGIGSCGRELCCSTWLTEFKSVSTAAARYQNLAINQTKLSGQCGRLKCCLNFELDTYTEALKEFPKGAKLLRTKDGLAGLRKTNVFNQLMYYSYADSAHVYALTSEQVKEILEINKRDELAEGLAGINTFEEVEEVEVAFVEDGKVSLKNLEKVSRNRRNKNRKLDKNRPANKKGASSKDKRPDRNSGKNDRRLAKPENRKPEKGQGTDS
ncbi:MAG: cell fate regulator YaaT (PSP1 superfamily), partial [Limisphaerales bacterium]